MASVEITANNTGFIRLAIIALGLWVSYASYNKLPIIPDFNTTPVVDDTVIIEEDVIVFPDKPTDEKLLSLLAPLEQTQLEDAYLLAQLYKQGAEFTLKSSQINSILDFAKAHENALVIRLSDANITGEYQGELIEAINDAYQYQMEYLKTPDGISSTEMDSVAKKKISDWMNAVSWKFADTFQKKLEKKDKDEVSS